MDKVETIMHVAAAMWKAEAIDTGTPQSIVNSRTPEAFLEQSTLIIGKWLKFAQVAISTISANTAPPTLSDALALTGKDWGYQTCYPLDACIWWRESTNEWVLEIEGSINDTGFTYRHTQSGDIKPEDVAGLRQLYGQTKPTLSDALAMPEIKALVEAAKDISREMSFMLRHNPDKDGGMYRDAVNAVDAALAALTEKE